MSFPREENIRINYKHQFVTIWNNLPAVIKDVSRLSAVLKKIELSSNGELLIAINFCTVFTYDLVIFLSVGHQVKCCLLVTSSKVLLKQKALEPNNYYC